LAQADACANEHFLTSTVSQLICTELRKLCIIVHAVIETFVYNTYFSCVDASLFNGLSEIQTLAATLTKNFRQVNIDKKDCIKIFLGWTFMTSISALSIEVNFLFGWLGLFFFGFLSIMFLIKIFKSNFKWVSDTNINSKEFADKTSADFSRLYNDNGLFTSDTGFIIKTEKGNKTIEWKQIETLIGYKKDYLTTDCICLVVEYNDTQNFEITEEHSGWFQFLEHLKTEFSTVDKSWEIEISTPAFETKMTVLYDRQNRTLGEIHT